MIFLVCINGVLGSGRMEGGEKMLFLVQIAIYHLP